VTDPADDPALARSYTQKLAWTGCGGRQQCGWLTVPVDWAAPAGDTLRIRVARIRAGDDQVGALVFNPGGPGVSAVKYLKFAESLWSKKIRSAYDQVAFDPRGVGESEPVRCLPDSQLDAYVAADSTPDDPAEVASTVATAKTFSQACVANSGELIRHVDTISVIRDLDVLRAALGQKLLVFHGTSYGTFVGAWYAQTFPWRVGRFLLDSAVDPSLTSAQYSEGQARGFSRALRAFLQDCLDGRNCPVRGTQEQALQQVGDLVRQADSAPLRTQTDRRLTQTQMILGIGQALYSTTLWESLKVGLKEALAGDGTTLLALADEYLERDKDGRYGQTLAANPSMYCLDFGDRRSVDQLKAEAARLLVKYPPLGDSIGWGALSCTLWPVPAVLEPQKLAAPGAAPILVVGTVDDPATPYEWAEGLALQLSSGRLLTWTGHQHTAYRQGSRCIDQAVDDYLLQGTLPAEGTRCS
jgi:pimeloyl-ACP methyl ester carboxylesterase